MIERPDPVVVLHGYKRSHVQRRAHVRSAAPPQEFLRGALASTLTAVAVQRSHADELGNLLAIGLAQLWKLCNERMRGGLAYPWNAAQKLGFFLPHRTLFHSLLKLTVGFVDLLFDSSTDRLNALTHRLGRSCAEAVLLGGAHLDELASAGDKRRKHPLFLIRQRSDLRTHALGEERQDARVDPIRFGQAPAGFSEVARLPWIDHCHRQAGGAKRGGDGALIAAGRFENDTFRSGLAEALDKSRSALWRVLEALAPGVLASQAQGQIQVLSGYVNLATSMPAVFMAGQKGKQKENERRSVPALQMRARPQNGRLGQRLGTEATRRRRRSCYPTVSSETSAWTRTLASYRLQSHDLTV